MPEFLISAAFAVLSVTAIGLAWAIARGGVLQHMMAAQLLGTGGTGAVLLLALAYETQAMVDVALVLVILASFSIGRIRNRRSIRRSTAHAAGERQMTALATIFTVTCVIAGVVFFLAGTVGLLRFPDPLSRIHALSKADNLGLGLVVLGLIPQAPDFSSGLKLAGVWLLAQLSAATVSQIMAGVATHDERQP